MESTIPSSEKVLRLDRKGRVVLSQWVKEFEKRFGPLSGFVPRIENDEIILSPRVERNPKELETLVLSDADRDAFLAALADPPAPNEKLKKAAARYRREVSSK